METDRDKLTIFATTSDGGLGSHPCHERCS